MRPFYLMVGYAMSKAQTQQDLIITQVNGKHLGTLVYKGKKYEIKERDVFRVIPGLYKKAGLTK